MADHKQIISKTALGETELILKVADPKSGPR